MSTHAVVIEDESAGHFDGPADRTTEAVESRIARTERRRIDVSELDTAGVERFVEENVGTHLVSLEHRGSRTYLILE